MRPRLVELVDLRLGLRGALRGQPALGMLFKAVGHALRYAAKRSHGHALSREEVTLRAVAEAIERAGNPTCDLCGDDRVGVEMEEACRNVGAEPCKGRYR